jgi:hypothetical protein
MTAVETYYSTLPVSDAPYYAGDYAEVETEENPFFAAAEQEVAEAELYRYF